MFLKIRKSEFYALYVVAKMAYPCITSAAKQTTHTAAIVIMVYVKHPVFCLTIISTTNSAQAALRFKQRFISFRRETVTL